MTQVPTKDVVATYESVVEAEQLGGNKIICTQECANDALDTHEWVVEVEQLEVEEEMEEQEDLEKYIEVTTITVVETIQLKFDDHLSL